MAGLNDILNSARSSLIAQQLAMEVTSNNVANANTTGYSRERVDFEQSPAVPDELAAFWEPAFQQATLAGPAIA